MSRIWQSFLPYHVLQQLTARPQTAPTDFEQRLQVVALFADVSGFTAISEALGSAGKSGTEELTTLLNSYFEPMIALIHTYGGIIAKFGGDAMTVFFPYSEDAYAPTVRRAVQCALNMQAKMSDYENIQTQAGPFSLAMKAGLASGELFSTVVGHPALRLESIIAGTVLDRSAGAEHLAQKGEVVIHKALLAASLDMEMETIAAEENFCLVKSITEPDLTAPLSPVGDLSLAIIETISAFIPPTIVQRIKTNQTSFINEHRKATILFVGFHGFDYDHDPEVGSKLQSYLYRIIQIVEQYDGYLNKVDMGDKGSKYIILFGVPLAHEDDENRALRCALDIQAMAHMPVRIGINTGFVFSGQVGSEARQEYTVMGDAVNLAARLMQAAETGQTLVNTAVQKTTADSFVWGDGRFLNLKGKTAPTKVYPLHSLKRRATLQLQEPTYALPMVGRETALNTIGNCLQNARQSQGQIIGITAEAGMGKSRLSAEAIKLALEQGMSGYGGECLSHGVNTSYLVWKNLLRGLFGLDAAWPLERQIQHLEAYLSKIDQSLVPRLPLLGRALNLPIPDNDLTQSMDAQLRKESREALIVDCIDHAARENPLLLILEDCHWIDDLSNDLLQAVGRYIANSPVAMLVIYRPPEADYMQPQVTRLGHFVEIALTEFTYQESTKLIGLKLAQFFGELSSIPVEFIERITERAQGNPFYIDEMINLIRDREIDPSDLQALQTLDLPGSLHSLIISRLDQLAEATKTTLKVASVIGRLFRARWLWEVYPELGVPERVRQQLALLNKLDITPVESPDSEEIEYLFKHILTREVAYESLAVATRKMLHEQIGLYIEHSFPDDRDQYVDLLAYHFSSSLNQAKQQEYLLRAGQIAQAAYANNAAIDYYQRLIPLLTGVEKSAVTIELGRIQQLLGNWEDAETAYRTALAIALEVDREQTVAQCEFMIGTLARVRGAYDEALTWLLRSLERFETANNLQGEADVKREVGIIHWSQGNFSQALESYEACLQIAQSISDRRGVCRAIGNMGLVYWTLGEYERALESYGRYETIATDIGDKLGVSRVMGNLGAVYLDLGDYHRALVHFANNLHIALELGYRQGISISVGNMGEVYAKQGEFRSSLACYRYNLAVALEVGDRLGVSFAIWGMANAYGGQGNLETADSLLQQAITIGRLLNVPYELCEYLYTQADLLMQQENFLQAQRVNDEALQIAIDVSHPQIQFDARLLQERLYFATRQVELDASVAALTQMLDDELDETARAEVLYAIWQVNGQAEFGEETAVLCQKLYAQTPDIKYKRRYETLTGSSLPIPPELPPLPQIVTGFTTTLDTLLQQVEAFIQEIAA